MIEECKYIFPDVEDADPTSGILAVGADLEPSTLLYAYSKGIFPWFNEDDPIIWHAPDPRCVLFFDDLKVSKSMRPYFNQQKFTLTINQNFTEVIRNCRFVARKDQDGSWITNEIIDAYTRLHHMGYAHSFEVWEQDQLVGGLYGMSVGRVFVGESMFQKKSNASKFAFISLVRFLQENDFDFLDCQVYNPHLGSLGARDISRREYTDRLTQALI